MKICLVVPGGVDRGGRERVIPAILWIIERLAREHQVLVIALNQYPQPCNYQLLGAQVVNLGQSAAVLPELRLPERLWQIRSALRSVGVPDVFHAFWANESGVVAGIIGKMYQRPVLLTFGGGELIWLPQIQYGHQGTWRTRWRVALALRLAAAVTAGSRFVMRDASFPYHWVPWGVDTVHFTGPVVREPGPPWRLIHVASINHVKDQETLLRALAAARQSLPGIHLDWVGEDTLNGRLQARARALGQEAAVTFHGFVAQDQLAHLYRRAHLFVQSSLHEGQGVAVCEAAACGVPTVGTAVGLVAEMAPEAAAAVAPGQPEEMAAAILELLRDPARRQRLGHAAQAWARRYDADWTAAEYLSLYRNLLGQP